MARAPRSRIDRSPSDFRRQAVPIGSTMLASMVPVLPFIALSPSVPPFGFMMLLAWRSLHRTLWPVWMAVPLGFFDDLFSGQPMGSAILLWTLAFLAFELFDRRMIWRDYWQEWGIASLLVAIVLAGGLWIADMTGGDTSLVRLLPQMVFSALLFPLVTRQCTLLDRWRVSL
jgi:rod shape-determining protein MreD